jgi:hypothetical protein
LHLYSLEWSCDFGIRSASLKAVASLARGVGAAFALKMKVGFPDFDKVISYKDVVVGAFSSAPPRSI